MIVEESEEVNGDDVKVSENLISKDYDEDVPMNGNHENHRILKASKEFEIADNFLQNMFKYDEETEAKVWSNERSNLPATVQVVMISKEKNESQAFR